MFIDDISIHLLAFARETEHDRGVTNGWEGWHGWLSSTSLDETLYTVSINAVLAGVSGQPSATARLDTLKHGIKPTRRIARFWHIFCSECGPLPREIPTDEQPRRSLMVSFFQG